MWWHTVKHWSGKWRGNWRIEWLPSTLHTTTELGVSSITTADAHTSAASSRLNWRPRRFKWTRPFRRKTKSGFCACAITFWLTSTTCRGYLCSSSLPPHAPPRHFESIFVVGAIFVLHRKDQSIEQPVSGCKKRWEVPVIIL